MPNLQPEMKMEFVKHVFITKRLPQLEEKYLKPTFKSLAKTNTASHLPYASQGSQSMFF